MKQVELLASYWTIAGAAMPHSDHEYSPFSFQDRVEVAAKVGFKGLGLWHADLAHILERGNLKEMKQILDDNGMYLELEFLTDWVLDGEKKKRSDVVKKNLLTAAAALGARHIKVGDFLHQTCPMPRLIEAFAALCAEAADHGTKIVFELMPFGMINTLQAALTMVGGAGAKNGGLIFDLWHVVKLGIPYEQVGGVPAPYLLAVELNDGTFHAPWSLHEDTVNHRRLCGAGEFDIKGFIDCLERAGYRGPFGIEVLSQELRTKPLEELVTRSFETTMEQFRR